MALPKNNTQVKSDQFLKINKYIVLYLVSLGEVGVTLHPAESIQVDHAPTGILIVAKQRCRHRGTVFVDCEI